jgi:hypothetical protein
MGYRITNYTRQQAKKLGVIDYPTYMRLEKEGKVEKGTAKDRRKNYKIRHQNNRNKKGTNGWYADKLLW